MKKKCRKKDKRKFNSNKNCKFAALKNNLKLVMTGTTRYYRHFKGGKYKVLAIGQDSESLAPVVIYQALYGDHKVWVRPKEMFDGVVVRDGKTIKRFTEITKEEAYEK